MGTENLNNGNTVDLSGQWLNYVVKPLLVLQDKTNKFPNLAYIGVGSFGTGSENQPKGSYSACFGHKNTVDAEYATSFGLENTVTGANSFVNGIGNNITHPYCFVHGDNLASSAEGQILFGKYNKLDENVKFAIGVGTAEGDRKDSFAVYKDGHAELTNQGTTDNSIVIKKTLSRLISDSLTVGDTSLTTEQIDEKIDERLKIWFDAMPAPSVQFFRMSVSKGGSVVESGGNMVRIWKYENANDGYYGVIEVSSYHDESDGFLLHRAVKNGNLSNWVRSGPYVTDTRHVKSTDSTLHLISKGDSSNGDFGMKITMSDATTGYVVPYKTNANMKTMNLGTNTNPWSNVYATSGTIQTSSRDAKENIKNVISELTPSTMSLSGEPTELSDITAETLVDFVRNLQPVTFNYKGDSHQEAKQLGLIADDIADHPVYKYLGIDRIESVEICPAEYDESGNIVKQAVTEEKRVLGLQALPLATVALTVCKHLINKVDYLEELLNEK